MKNLCTDGREHRFDENGGCTGENCYAVKPCPKCGVIHDVDLAAGHDLIEADKVLRCECVDHPDDEYCRQVLAGDVKENNVVVHIAGGVCTEVTGLPEGWTYTVEDEDI